MIRNDVELEAVAENFDVFGKSVADFNETACTILHYIENNLSGDDREILRHLANSLLTKNFYLGMKLAETKQMIVKSDDKYQTKLEND